jgi:hypothetical protein
MATATRREAHVCPDCSLTLVVVHTADGKTIEYDISEWARLCRHPEGGSPLACPSLQQVAESWVRKPQQRGV